MTLILKYVLSTVGIFVLIVSTASIMSGILYLTIKFKNKGE